MSIIFIPEDHRYYNEDNDRDYISTTTLLKNYEPSFDPTGKIAERCAKRDGVSVEDILAKWAKTSKAGTDKGSSVHNAVEDYIKTGHWDENHDKILLHFMSLFDEHLRDTIHSEYILSNDKFEVAGTADILIEGTNWFKVWDIKTNKQIRFTNSFHSDRFLFDPVSHLTNCEFNKYSLQLSIYAFMYEIISGKPCTELRIIYAKPNEQAQPGGNNYSIEEYYIPYLKTDVINIFKHYERTKLTR